MHILFIFLPIFRVAGVLLCSSLFLCAVTITVNLNSINPSMTVSGSFTGSTGFAPRLAGFLNFDYGDAFCVEPLQPVSGEVVYTIEPTINLTNSDSIKKVMGAYLQSSKTSLQAAGAQWAIWEIVNDGINNPSFRNGSVQIFFDRRASVDALNIETTALGYINLSRLPNTPSAPILYLTHPSSQNVAFLIPEPGSALLGILGVTGLLIRRRR